MKKPIVYPETRDEALRNNPLIEGTHHFIPLFAEGITLSHYLECIKGIVNENPNLYNREDVVAYWEGLKAAATELVMMIDELEKTSRIRFK